MGTNSKSDEVQEANKVLNQLGEEVGGEDRDEDLEIVHLLMGRKEVEQIKLEKLERFSRQEIVMQAQAQVAQVTIAAARALIAVVGKEKAKEAFNKEIYDFNFALGKQAAESLGNPKDLDSFIKKRLIKDLPSYSMAPPVEVTERTKTRFVSGSSQCHFADALRQFAKVFPEWANKDALEVAASNCHPMDAAWTHGFNPDMKFKRTHYQLSDLIGEGPAAKCCFFECEVSEE